MAQKIDKTKIKKFLKTNFQKLIGIAIILIIGVIFIRMTFRAQNKLTSYTISNQKLYTYFDTERVDFDSKITISKKDGSYVVETSNSDDVLVDSLPLYYDGEDQVIFPSPMSVIFPLDNVKQKKLSSYTLLDMASSNYPELKYNKEVYDMQNMFIYDGNDLYFFVEETTLKFNGESVTLSPLSFVMYNNLTHSLSYYDYNKEAKYIENVEGDITASTKKYEVNLVVDGVKYGDDYKLLIKNIDILNNLF